MYYTKVYPFINEYCMNFKGICTIRKVNRFCIIEKELMAADDEPSMLLERDSVRLVPIITIGGPTATGKVGINELFHGDDIGF